MPSHTFVSSANLFVMQGATPVFVDIRPDTLNIEMVKIAAAITQKTRAIVVVHYAGVACELDAIMRIADEHDLSVIEDAAHGILSTYKGRSLGSIGHLAALSFHETKNIIAGEGGALLINSKLMLERAEIIWQKGANRNQFRRGAVDKYTWVDTGLSFLPGEVVAAFLWAQLEEADAITQKRIEIWRTYHRWLETLEKRGLVQRPHIPAHCSHNAHMYHVLLHSERIRNDTIAQFGTCQPLLDSHFKVNVVF